MYNKGEQIPLYIEFKQDNAIIFPETVRVRVLHEKDDNVYEDMSWKNMTPFGDGFIYHFDSNICDTLGEHAAVYEGIYNGEKLHNIQTFDISVPNESNLDSINNIKIYGIISELSSHKTLKDVNVKITNLIDGNVSAITTSDYSGRWETFIFPGEFEFEFSLDGFITKKMQVQIGDENNEVQFNNVSLENKNDISLGNGIFQINDEFTDKTGKGIEGIEINIYSLNDMNKLLVSVKTDFYGKWKAFLDEGGYILKIKLPSGVEKLFRMNINHKGEKSIAELKQSDSVAIENKNTTIGNKSITDYVKDAHGNGLSNVSIKVYKNDQLVGETFTGIDGEFTLNLDEGVYKVICEKNNFKSYSFELKI